MPLYEYQCDACGHRFEVIQKFSDAPIEVCSACGGSVRKLLSSPAIQFKGSGWYVTDYARKGQAPTEKPEAAPADKKEKPETAKGSPPSTSAPSSPAASTPAPPSTSKDS